MRHNQGVEARRLRSALLLGAMLALVAGHAQAQKSAPPPPPPPKKGKVYPKAKDYGPPARILKLDPEQKKIDLKLLKTAPTVNQAMRRKQAKAIAKRAGTPAKAKPTIATGKLTKLPVKPAPKAAPKKTAPKKTAPKKVVPKKAS